MNDQQSQLQALAVGEHHPILTVQENGNYYNVDCACGAPLGDRRMPVMDVAWTPLWWPHAAKAYRDERDALRRIVCNMAYELLTDVEWCVLVENHPELEGLSPYA